MASNLRSEIDERLTATLRRDLHGQLPGLDRPARRDVQERLQLYGETDAAARLPDQCRYDLDQILGDFGPDATP